MKKHYMFLLTVFLAGYWISMNGQTAPGQGDILITEIMINPEAVSDANGEWFEIFNATDHDLLLNGLSLKDAGSNSHVLTAIGNLIIPAKGFWVLAKNGDALTNGGITPNYVYQNFVLSNTSDQLILTDPNGTLIDQVSYGAGWPVVSGASMELHPDYHSFSENDLPEHWFPARLVYGAGDKGSPGKLNPISAGLDEWEFWVRLDVFPNPSPGAFILEATFSKPQSGEIRMINLLGQDFIFKEFTSQMELREIIDPVYLTPGIWFIEVISEGKKKTARVVIER